MGRILAIAVAALLAAGCQTAQLRPSPVPASWLDRRGGTECGIRHERARRASLALDAVMRRPLDVHVLATDDVNAYAWPNGAIHLTRGLVDLLDDRELVAAIAHEAGHLVEAGRLAKARPASLAGDRHEEMAADDRGRALLATAGLSSDAMARMLAKVSRAVGPRTTRGRILAIRASRMATPAHRAVRPTGDR